MKPALYLSLALMACAPAHAQVFGPWVGRGGHVHRHSSFHAYHARHSWHPRTSVSFVYGWGPARFYDYGYYGSVYRSYPVYTATPVYASSGYASPSRAGAGLFWGGLLGAIIGNNSGSLGHNAWRGAAYGAAAGYLLGAIGDSRARAAETSGAAVSAAPAVSVSAPAAIESAPTVGPAPSVAPAPMVPATRMSPANALFGRE